MRTGRGRIRNIALQDIGPNNIAVRVAIPGMSKRGKRVTRTRRYRTCARAYKTLRCYEAVTTAPRPTAADALQLGRRRFLHGERIDMSALADELGINRVTLYRWYGSRDQFLVELIWSLARDTLDLAERHARARGPNRVVSIVSRFLEDVIANPGMQRWLADEGEHAMRLLTRHETDFQPRLIAAIEHVLRAETDAGRLDLAVDLHELAYVIVRLIESYTYLDLITGETPDARRAEPILRMLVRADP